MKKKKAIRGRDLEVKISVGEHGDLTIAPTTLFATKHDRLSWSCDDGGFLVAFQGETPLEVVTVSRSNPGASPHKPIRASAPPGVYHYAVTVGSVLPAARGGGSDVRLVITAGCPEIIVDNG